MIRLRSFFILASLFSCFALVSCAGNKGFKKESWSVSADEPDGIRLAWEKTRLSIYRDNLPGGKLEVWYLEAYCRPGSTDRVWRETVIPHRTELISAEDRKIVLRCHLPRGNAADGDDPKAGSVVVDHEITASRDEIAFWVRAENHGSETVDAHWVQPCAQMAEFTGRTQTTYQEKSFIFNADGLAFLHEIPRNVQARYTPGQVFVPKGIDHADVNPRPISPVVPANGLIGCFSDDGNQLMAMAWEPYQELFQGVIVCLHSDFRLGGLEPGEVKIARGKVYLLAASPGAAGEGGEEPSAEESLSRELLERYELDFPEHR